MYKQISGTMCRIKDKPFVQAAQRVLQRVCDISLQDILKNRVYKGRCGFILRYEINKTPLDILRIRYFRKEVDHRKGIDILCSELNK